MNKLLLSLILLSFTTAFGQIKNNKMKDTFTFEGRINFDESTAKIYWPGSSISFELEGSYLDIILSDNGGESAYAIIIDGVEQENIIRPTSSKKSYRIWESVKEEKHTFIIHRRTDYTKGTTTFYGIETDGKFAKIPKKQKHIEFYGNSITVGYANVDTTGEDNPYYTNNYKAYSALTARHFDAEMTCIARSGIGVTVSWFDLIMPELYDRLNPNVPNSQWDFKQKTPDLIVVNLLQNDSWLYQNPTNENYIKRIGRSTPDEKFIVEHYKVFIQSIREKYPNTNIVCVAGCMDLVRDGSPWYGYVEKAIEQLKDNKIYTYKMPFLSKGSHPNVEIHKEMSTLLIEFIDKKHLL